MALAGISFGVAYSRITPLTEWLRDIAPYVLFASVPVFALDAQASLGRRRLVQLLVAAGVLGVMAWAVEWLGRRGIAHFDASSIAVASVLVPAALFAYAMASALHGRAKRVVWLLVAAAVLEDKGLIFGLILIIALALAETSRPAAATRKPRPA
jgi:Kef-type K+ transport system membrane component KefB